MTPAAPPRGPVEQALEEAGRVDFYLLSAAEPAARMRFACRLAEKAYQLSNRVHLHAASAADAAELDELLWTFRQGSFVPHQLADGKDAVASPVTIGFGAIAPPADLLVNLGADVPTFAGNYPRIAEVVDAGDASRAMARERFRHYRQLGMKPDTHQIGNSP